MRDFIEFESIDMHKKAIKNSISTRRISFQAIALSLSLHVNFIQPTHFHPSRPLSPIVYSIFAGGITSALRSWSSQILKRINIHGDNQASLSICTPTV